ncbi:MAG: MBL fold metallo-hydrolase [Terrimicrobiaceae bacterium]|nr:MBL fold metallo-hydrolase [Terrimicrobiaceae bacterium]
MLEVTILASGSAGNSALVRCGGTTLLLDAGLTARRLTERLAACGVAPDALDGIVVTHEHSDHIAALRVLCAKRDIPVYANRMTAAALEAGPLAGHRNWRFFAGGTAFAIGALTVEAFSVPHDAADPVGFLIRNAAATFGLLTDLGHATQLVIERMREADALFIETNYDEALLQGDTRRPWSVKQRISSRHGHLSNAAAAGVVAELAEGRLSAVLLGHLSRDCNTAELAVAAIAAPLARCGRHDVPIHCAGQETVSPALRVNSRAA